MSSKINQLKASLIKGTILAIILHFGILSFAQNYEYGLDKHKRKEQEKKHELDSLLIHLKNKWQISLSYGRFHFDNSVQSKERSLLDFPQNLGAWSLSGARYLSEHLSINANLGILVRKVEPPRPDIFSIINGADVEIEGGGIIITPLSVGVDYFFLKKRFRPYVGFGIGTSPSKYTYVEASGNLFNGIIRNERNFNGNAPFVELSSGFIYRTGKNFQLGFNCDYLQSRDFKEDIGSYKAFNGIKISTLFSFVF